MTLTLPGLPLILVIVGLLLWILGGKYADIGKWTYIVALAAWLWRG